MKQFTGTRLQAERIIQKIIIIIKQKKRGHLNGCLFFYLSEKQYNAILNMNLPENAVNLEKTAWICQYTRTCAAGNSGRMERKT